MKRVGYAWDTHDGPGSDGQVAKLKAESCEITRREKVSGASSDRREAVVDKEKPQMQLWAENAR